MNPYEDEERRRRNGEKLLRVTEEARKTDRGSRIKFLEFFKKLPIKGLLIGGLIVCACLIGLALGERVRAIGADMDRLKTQVKSQVTGLESKLEQSAKENEQLKNELAQIKTELEGIRAENQKRLSQQARSAAVKKAGAGKQPKKKP